MNFYKHFFIIFCVALLLPTTALAAGENSVDLTKEKNKVSSDLKSASESSSTSFSILDFVFGKSLSYLADLIEKIPGYLVYPTAERIASQARLEAYKVPVQDVDEKVDAKFKKYLTKEDKNAKLSKQKMVSSWETINSARQSKEDLKRVCPDSVFDCVMHLGEITRLVYMGNSEAISSANFLWQSNLDALSELDAMGADQVKYSEESSVAFEKVSKSLEDLREDPSSSKEFHFLASALTSYNSVFPKGESAEVWKPVRKSYFVSACNDFIRGIDVSLNCAPLKAVDAFTFIPMDYSRPFNRLAGYTQGTGMVELLKLRNELTGIKERLIKEKEESFKEAVSLQEKAGNKIKSVEEQEPEKTDLVLIRKIDLSTPNNSETPEETLDESKKLLQKSEELYKKSEDKFQIMKGSKDPEANYVTDSVLLAQRSSFKSDSALKKARECNKDLEELLEKAEQKFQKNLEQTKVEDKVTRLFLKRAKQKTQGKTSKTIGQSLKDYATAITYLDYIHCFNTGECRETKKTFPAQYQKTRQLLERAEEDGLLVSVEEEELKKIKERREEISEEEPALFLPEYDSLTKELKSIRERIVIKATKEFGNLNSLREKARKVSEEDKFSQYFSQQELILPEAIGKLKEIQAYYKKLIEEFEPHVYSKVTGYEFLETPSCNKEKITIMHVRVFNPFQKTLEDIETNFASIKPVYVNSTTAFFHDGKMNLFIDSVNGRQSRNFLIKAKTVPMGCSYGEQEIRVKAKTDLSKAELFVPYHDFVHSIESLNTRVTEKRKTSQGTMMTVRNLPEGETTIEVKKLEDTEEDNSTFSNATSPEDQIIEEEYDYEEKEFNQTMNEIENTSENTEEALKHYKKAMIYKDAGENEKALQEVKKANQELDEIKRKAEEDRTQKISELRNSFSSLKKKKLILQKHGTSVSLESFQELLEKTVNSKQGRKKFLKNFRKARDKVEQLNRSMNEKAVKKVGEMKKQKIQFTRAEEKIQELEKALEFPKELEGEIYHPFSSVSVSAYRKELKKTKEKYQETEEKLSEPAFKALEQINSPPNQIQEQKQDLEQKITRKIDSLKQSAENKLTKVSDSDSSLARKARKKFNQAEYVKAYAYATYLNSREKVKRPQSGSIIQEDSLIFVPLVLAGAVLFFKFAKEPEKETKVKKIMKKI